MKGVLIFAKRCKLQADKRSVSFSKGRLDSDLFELEISRQTRQELSRDKADNCFNELVF